jgi:hypothetical protein
MKKIDLIQPSFLHACHCGLDMVQNLVQRLSTPYTPALDPYAEIEKKWLMTDYGKKNFDKWWEDSQKAFVGDALIFEYSYVSNKPELRLRKVTVKHVNSTNRKNEYWLDIKKTTGRSGERITQHEALSATEFNAYKKHSIGNCTKYFMPFYKNVYQISKVVTKGKSLLYTVEVEFDNRREMTLFKPDREICGDDVTDKSEYSTRVWTIGDV